MIRKWVSSPAYDAAIRTLIAARNRQGLSQRAVEGRLGKSFHGFIAKIERKERQMNLVEFIAIARALGLPEKDLFADVVQALPDELDI
jgi:transcriptional regulator with XRE-family HTH domain